MSCAVVRCPGFWNSVNSASSKRTMITQRAKLRRLAFILVSFAVGGPAALLLVSCQQVKADSRPSRSQSRCRGARCQGNRLHFSHSTAVCDRPRLPYLAVVKVADDQRRWSAPERARPRAGRQRASPALPPTCAAAGRFRAASPPRALVSVSQSASSLPSCDRPFIAALRDRTAEQPQCHLGGQTERIFRHRRRSDRDRTTALCDSARRRNADRRLDRRLGAPQAARQQRKRRASSPSRASAGITARSRARVKRGSRFDASSAKAMPARASVATSRAFGMPSSGRTSMISLAAAGRQRRHRRHGAEPGEAAAARHAGSARSRPDRRACGR